MILLALWGSILTRPRMMSINKVVQKLFVFTFCQLLALTSAKRNQALYCGACQALVDEVQYAIDSEDPTEMIDFGFRIDPMGGTKKENVKFAGSEMHVMEILEEVCDDMQDYAENRSTKPNSRKYIRYKSRMMEPIELENVNISAGVQKSLELACVNIIEEYEDEILRLFRTKQENIADQLCTDIAQYCKKGKEEL